jgi:predicted transcriptional regulator
MSKGEMMIERLLSSEAKAELLRLFHRNPGLIDTIDNVARRIGRTGNPVASDVNDLVELGVLGKKRIGKSEVVFVNRARDKEIQDVIASHMRNSNATKDE